jgi:hypothetical protein
MTEPTYTMFLRSAAGAARVVARGVDAGKAMSIALDYGQAFRARVACRSGSTCRFYEITRRGPDFLHELVMAVRVPRTSDEIEDSFAAADAFVEMFLSDPARFWDGEILTDAEFAFEAAVDWMRFADLVAARRLAPPTPVVAGTPTKPHT